MRKLLKVTRLSFWIIALAALTSAWPLSFVHRNGLGIALENTPAFGWIVDFDGITDFEGYGIGLDHGYFFAFAYNPVLNPKPPLTGTYNTLYGVDGSRWLGSVRQQIGIGTVLTGNLFHREWTARTGIAFPFWPVSTMAVLLLLLTKRNLIRRRRNVNLGLCPTCSYDLRAHSPNSTCPECGTPIPASPQSNP